MIGSGIAYVFLGQTQVDTVIELAKAKARHDIKVVRPVALSILLDVSIWVIPERAPPTSL